MTIAATSEIKYVTDTAGKRTEVIVPYRTWTNITGELQALKEKQRILFDLHQACREVKKQEKGELEEQTLDEFLNEL